jgi:hypothetical protein
VEYLEDDEYDEYVVPDGGVVRVPLMLMDSRQRAVASHYADSYVDRQLLDNYHSPGYRAATDAATRNARAAAIDARDEYVARLTDAWRTKPMRDCAEPDIGSPPDPAAPEALGTPEAQRRRDAVYAKYRDALQNAWRTNPSAAANAIERQGEQWRHGR